MLNNGLEISLFRNQICTDFAIQNRSDFQLINDEKPKMMNEKKIVHWYIEKMKFTFGESARDWN